MVKRTRESEPLTSPRELAERFWSEIRDLRDLGEISPQFAQRLVDDLFEPWTPGQAPTLKWSVWCRYVQDEQDRATIHAIRRDG